METPVAGGPAPVGCRGTPEPTFHPGCCGDGGGLREWELLHPSLGCGELETAPLPCSQQDPFGEGRGAPCPPSPLGRAHQPFPMPLARPAPSLALSQATMRLPCSGRGLESVPAALLPRRDECPVVLPLALESVSGGRQLPASSPALLPACSQRQREKMPLPRNAKMLSTKQSRAGKVGPAAANPNPEKVSPNPGKGCGRAPVRQLAPHLQTVSIAGGELSGQEISILTPGWAQEEVGVW